MGAFGHLNKTLKELSDELSKYNDYLICYVTNNSISYEINGYSNGETLELLEGMGVAIETLNQGLRQAYKNRTIAQLRHERIEIKIG